MVAIKEETKKISQLREGDRVFVDGHELIVEKHYLFIDHKTTREMIIELVNAKNKKKYQIRYFDDQVETSLEFYFLQGDFQYVRVDIKEIWW